MWLAAYNLLFHICVHTACLYTVYCTVVQCGGLQNLIESHYKVYIFEPLLLCPNVHTMSTKIALQLHVSSNLGQKAEMSDELLLV